MKMSREQYKNALEGQLGHIRSNVQDFEVEILETEETEVLRVTERTGSESAPMLDVVEAPDGQANEGLDAPEMPKLEATGVSEDGAKPPNIAESDELEPTLEAAEPPDDQTEERLDAPKMSELETTGVGEDEAEPPSNRQNRVRIGGVWFTIDELIYWTAGSFGLVSWAVVKVILFVVSREISLGWIDVCWLGIFALLLMFPRPKRLKLLVELIVMLIKAYFFGDKNES